MALMTRLAPLLAVSLLAVPERTVVLPSQADQAVAVTCPVGRVTRLIFPEPLKRLKGLGSARAALGLRVERLSPAAILVIEPLDHPAEGTIEFVGTTLQVRLELKTVAEGEAADIRIVAAGDRAEVPASQPSPARANLAAPEASPAPLPAVPAPSATSGLDLAGLLTAEAVPINRREGLPGQPALRLLDALKGDRWIWFRMRLEGGAATRVRRVFWEHGDITTFSEEKRAGDLSIIVQVPRSLVRRRSRLSIETDTGVLYRIALRRATLPGLLGSLFQ
jgi:hypothetical protein